MRQFAAIVVDDLHLDAKDRPPRLGLDPPLALRIEPGVLCLQRRDGAERAHFGHAPALHHIDAARLEGGHQRGRHRRAAGEHAAQCRALGAGRRQMRHEIEPHRRYPEAQRDAFRLEQFVEAGAVEARPRPYQLRPVHRRGIGGGPAASVEQRHDRTHHIRCGHRDRMRQRCGERVDHCRAVAVEDAFWVAGGAGGVAKRRGVALVELGPVEILALGREQSVIGRQHRQRRLRLAEEDDPAVLGQ